MKKLILILSMACFGIVVSAQTQTQSINMANFNLTNVNNITVNDPGPFEGLQWLGTTAGWSIDVSPLSRANSDGNLNFYGTANDIVFWRPLKFYKLGPNQDNINILSFAENTNNHFWLQGMFAGVGSTGNSIRFKSAWDDNVLFMRGDGNVGIGTGSPTTKLHISTMESGEAIVRIEADTDNNNENDNPRIELMQDGGLLGSYIGFNQAWGGPIADNLFIIGTRYSGVDNFKRFVIRTDNGNVGIGNDNPESRLEITGEHSTGNFDSQLHLRTTNTTYGMYLGSHAATYGVISQGSQYNSGGDFKARSSYASGIIQNNGYMYLFSNSGLTSGNIFTPEFRMTVSNNGNVGIGTATPGNKLEVNGTIRSKQVKVEATGWPDYVFTPSYELRALSEVESHIKEKGHLPEVPSAKEIEEKGLDLGAMDASLLKKVEELTLYLIDQNKDIKKVSLQNSELKKENQNLKERLTQIEKLVETLIKK